MSEQTIDATQALLAELAAALREWRASPEGQAFLASFATRSADEIRAQLDALVRGPHFDAVRKFSLKGWLADFLPKSLTVGFSGQIELGIGAYGSIGYITDLTLEDRQGGLYLLLADGEGLEGAADVSIQVGVWKKSADEVSGKYTGGEADGGDIIDGSVFALFEDEDRQAVLVDIDVGIADGLSALKYHMHTHVFGSSGPIAQAPASHMLILETLQCLDTSESGHDEVYLKFAIDGATEQYRYPTWSYYPMKPGGASGSWNLGRSVWCDEQVEVSVYDMDETSSDDLIASFTVKPSDFSAAGESHGKPYKYDKGGTKYTLTAYLMDLSL